MRPSGVDLHKTNFVVCVLEADDTTRTETYPLTVDGLTRFTRQLRISVKMSKDFGRREQARKGRVRRRIIYLACSRAVKPPGADASIRL